MSQNADEAVARRICTEVFIPALQEASREAKSIDGNPANLLNGLVLAFSETLISLIGDKGTTVLLRGLADHVERQGAPQ